MPHQPTTYAARPESATTSTAASRLSPRVETLRAALDAAGTYAGGESAELLHRRYELRLRHAEGTHAASESDQEDDQVVRAAIAAERRRLIELRENGTIGDAAFQQVEQELDVRELDVLENPHS